jgi:hypothetical protein
MFANNWAEMPQYLGNICNRTTEKEELSYIDEVTQEKVLKHNTYQVKKTATVLISLIC